MTREQRVAEAIKRSLKTQHIKEPYGFSITDIATDVEAALAEADAWQDISTVPSDRLVFMWAKTDHDTGNWKMGVGYYDPRLEEFTWDGSRLKDYHTKPTHWMPLPTPPKEKADKDTQALLTEAQEALEDLLDTPMTVVEATIPKYAKEDVTNVKPEHTNQVVLKAGHCLTKINKAKQILTKLKQKG